MSDPRQLPEDQYGELLKEHSAKVWASDNPFTIWLRTKHKQNGSIGSLARVMLQDPTWPYPETRQQMSGYFMAMGARPFVLQTANEAWNGFEQKAAADRKRAKNRAKGKQQRQARKRTRRAARR